MICLRVLSTRFRFKFTFVVNVERHICNEELPYIVDHFSGCLPYSHLLCAPAFSQSSINCFSDEPLGRKFFIEMREYLLWLAIGNLIMPMSLTTLSAED